MVARDSGVAERTGRTFSSVFNSSVPQRPDASAAPRYDGGRPIGPNTYKPPSPKWHIDPIRENAVFSSKTALRTYAVPLTAQLDFLGHADQVSIERGEAPGARGLHWPDPPQPREAVRDPGLDEFCDAMSFLDVSSQVLTSSRKYAASFQSATKRTHEPAAPTSPQLGPGVYDLHLESVRVRDPRRMNYTFKSQTSASLFGVPANQPPDSVQSIQSAQPPS